MPLSDKSKFTHVNSFNFDEIFAQVKNNDVQGLTTHWSVGTYDQLWDDYQFVILGDGSIWMNNAGWDEQGQHQPLDHMSHGQMAAADPLAQLWHRNTGNVGIALAAMYEATQPATDYKVCAEWDNFPTQYGPYKPTQAQMDNMAWLLAKLVRHYNLGFSEVKSHYQWAVIDGYADERWDLKYEQDTLMKQVQEIYEATKPKQ